MGARTKGTSMTIDKLRDALSAQPFLPFDVCLADGRQIPVLSREFILLPPGNVRTFVVATTEGTIKIIDLLHVASLDFGDGQQTSRNGRKKRS
jgi:hypothetical protein